MKIEHVYLNMIW